MIEWLIDDSNNNLNDDLIDRFINARRRIVQPMIDASSRAGKSPVVTIFKSRKRRNSSPDMAVHRELYPAQSQTHYQHQAYHPDYHYPSIHSGYYNEASSPTASYMPQSFPSCQYSMQTNNSINQSPSLPSCMETRAQVLQPSYAHWLAGHYGPNHNQQNYSVQGHQSDTQYQHGQFYVKAS